jgi:hypothetical protein
MLRPNARSQFRLAGALAAGLLLAVPAAAATPNVEGYYTGHYTPDGSTDLNSFNMELSLQAGKHVPHVSLFVMNYAEFQGGGFIKKKATVFRGLTKASGKHAPKLAFDSVIGPSARSFDGTYEIRAYKQTPVTGTFSVSR